MCTRATTGNFWAKLPGVARPEKCLIPFRSRGSQANVAVPFRSRPLNIVMGNAHVADLGGHARTRWLSRHWCP